MGLRRHAWNWGSSQLAALLEAALQHERTTMEAQSHKALALLHAKDEALALWEQEAATAREEASHTAAALDSTRIPPEPPNFTIRDFFIAVGWLVSDVRHPASS
jgi:hypothetical protein